MFTKIRKIESKYKFYVENYGTYKKIWIYRIRTIALEGVGIVFIIGGYKKCIIILLLLSALNVEGKMYLIQQNVS